MVNTAFLIIITILVFLVFIWLFLVNNPMIGMYPFITKVDNYGTPINNDKVYGRTLPAYVKGYSPEEIMGEDVSKYRDMYGKIPKVDAENVIKNNTVYAIEEIHESEYENLIKPKDCNCLACTSKNYIPQEELVDGTVQQSKVKPEGEFKYLSGLSMSMQNKNMCKLGFSKWNHEMNKNGHFTYIEATGQTLTETKKNAKRDMAKKSCCQKFNYGYHGVAPVNGDYLVSEHGKLIQRNREIVVKDDKGIKVMKVPNYDTWKEKNGRIVKANTNGNMLTYE